MGFRLSKIYTRTGDKGETGLGDGRRVPKDHPRIEAIGEVDTLNSQVGVLLAGLLAEREVHPGLNEIIEVLAPCQHRLFDLGGELAMPSYQALNLAEVERLEAAIDVWNEELGPLKNFILPSGSALVAQAHVCRSLARSAVRLESHGASLRFQRLGPRPRSRTLRPRGGEFAAGLRDVGRGGCRAFLGHGVQAYKPRYGEQRRDCGCV